MNFHRISPRATNPKSPQQHYRKGKEKGATKRERRLVWQRSFKGGLTWPQSIISIRTQHRSDRLNFSYMDYNLEVLFPRACIALFCTWSAPVRSQWIVTLPVFVSRYCGTFLTTCSIHASLETRFHCAKSLRIYLLSVRHFNHFAN